jgi:hypothetical protein
MGMLFWLACQDAAAIHSSININNLYNQKSRAVFYLWPTTLFVRICEYSNVDMQYLISRKRTEDNCEDTELNLQYAQFVLNCEFSIFHLTVMLLYFVSPSCFLHPNDCVRLSSMTEDYMYPTFLWSGNRKNEIPQFASHIEILQKQLLMCILYTVLSV